VCSPPSGAPSVSEPFITPVTSAAAPVDISTAAAVARSFSFLDPRLLGMVQHAVAALYDKHAQDLREVRQKVEADKQRGLDAMDTLCSQKDAALQVALRSVDGKDARIRELEGELAEAKKTHVSAAAAVKKVSEAEARAVAAEHAQKAAESKRHQAEAALADVQAMLASERLAHRAELEKAATERTASESKLSQVAIKAEVAAAELRALLAKAQDGLKAMTDAKVELENRVASMATDMALVTQTAAEMEDKLRMQVLEARALADAAQARGDALQTTLSSLALKRRSGTLLKRGGRWKAWRERHFVLVGQALVYHEGDVVKGCIALLPSSTIAPLDDADSAADGAGVQFQVRFIVMAL
jgi:chromosome segregation ATPase